MPNNVDTRVVEMKFDSKQFETNISKCMTALENLEKRISGLATTGPKSFNTLERSANNIRFANLASHVEEIAKRFSALGVVGVTALQNITTKAMTVAHQLEKTLTGPLIEGGKKRAQNIEQAKFQIEGLGKKWADVEEDINYGVQDTAYGLDAAAKAASQLLASDVQAGDQMKRSLRGISGVAAMTSSSYEDIANVFTTVAGNGRLMAEQLNSLASRGINAAASLAKYFREVRKETSVTEADIREMVSDSEIDFDTFATAMDWAFGEHAKEANKLFSGALSNMKAALARIGAEVATPIYQDLRDVINAFTPVINTVKEGLQTYSKSFEWIAGISDGVSKKIIKSFNALSYTLDKNKNRVYTKDAKTLFKVLTNIGDTIKNVGGFLVQIFNKIKMAFKTVFPPKSIKDVLRLTEYFKSLSENLHLYQDTGLRVLRISRGIFSIFGLLRTIAIKLAKVFKNVWTNTTELRNSLLETLANIGDFIYGVSESAKKSTLLNDIFLKLQKAFTFVAEGLRKVTNRIKEAFLYISGKEATNAAKRINLFSTIGKIFRNVFSSIGTIIANVFPAVVNFVKNGIKGISDFMSELIEAFKNKDLEKATDIFNKFLSAGVLISAKWFFDQLSNLVRRAKPITGSIQELLNVTRSAIYKFGQKVKYEMVYKIAKAVMMLTLAILILSGVDQKKAVAGIAIIGALFGELVASMNSLSKTFTGKGAKGLGSIMTIGNALIKMSVSVMILASAVQSLGELDWDTLSRGLTAVVSLLGLLTMVAKVLSFSQSKNFTKGVSGLIFMAVAIRIMANAVKSLSELNWEQLGRGLSAVGALVGLCIAFARLSGEAKKVFRLGISLVLMASAIKILSSAAKSFAEMSWEELGKAGAAIGSLLAALLAFVRFSGSAKKMVSVGIELVLISSAFKILSSSVKTFSQLNWEQLVAGLSAIGVLLAICTAFVRLNSGKKMISNSVALVIFGSSMLIFANAAKSFASISWEGLIKAGSAITVLLGAFAGFTKLVNAKSLGATAASLIVMGISLSILSGVVKSFGYLDWDVLGKAGIALLGVFAILGFAARYLAPATTALYSVSKALLAFSGAIAVFGLASVLLGTGLLLIEAAIAGLGGSIALLVKALAATLKQIIIFIPEALYAFGKAIGKFFSGLNEYLPEIFTSLEAIISGVFDILLASTVKLLDDLIETVVPIIVKNAPILIDALLTLIDDILDALISKVPTIIAKVGKLLSVIFSSILKLIGKVDPKAFTSAIIAFGALTAIFIILGKAKKAALSAIITGGAMVLVFGLLSGVFLLMNQIDSDKILIMAQSLSASLLAITACLSIVSFIPVPAALSGIAGLAVFVAGLTGVLAILGGLRQIPGLQWLIDEGAEMMQSIGRAIGKFVGGIIGGIGEGITAGFIGIADNLSQFMIRLTPFLIGAKLLTPESLQGVESLAKVILMLTAAEVLNGIAGWLTGGTSIVTFGNDLVALAPSLIKYSKAITKDGGINNKAVKASASAALLLAKFASALPDKGGIAQWFGGNKTTLANFGKQLTSFAPSMVKYSKAITKDGGINAKAVKASASAGMALAELANSLPDYDGVAQWFGGNKEHLSAFGDELALFGPKIKKFAKSVKGIKETHVTAIENVVAATRALGDTANGLPDYDGVAQWFGGNKEHLSAFGDELALFGPKFAEFASSIADIDTAVINNISAAAKGMDALSENLPKKTSIIETWFGGGAFSFSDFGSDLKDFGDAFKGYYDKIKDVDATKIGSITNVLSRVVTMVNTIGDTKAGSENFKTGINAIAESNIQGFVDTFNNLLTDEKQTSSIENLHKVGENIMLAIADGVLTKSDALSTKAGKAGLSLVSNLEEGLKSTHDSYSVSLSWYERKHDDFAETEKAVFKKIGERFGNALKNGLNSKKDAYNKVLNNYVNLTAAFSNTDTTYFTKFGKTIMSKLIAGMKDDKKRESYSSAINWLRKKNRGFTSSEPDKFYRTGVNIIAGLTNGILDNKLVPVNAINRVGNSMLTELNKTLDINSPSKEAYSSGQYTIKGLALGLLSLLSMAKNAGTKVGETTLDSINNPMSQIYSLFDDGFDPTITPVLDLSKIQNGSSLIASMLNGGTVGFKGMYPLQTNFDLMNDATIDTGYNDANVIEAINQLSKDISDLSEDMQNLRIVMDTGATVGALAPGLDRALGSITTHKGRGI